MSEPAAIWGLMNLRNLRACSMPDRALPSLLPTKPHHSHLIYRYRKALGRGCKVSKALGTRTPNQCPSYAWPEGAKAVSANLFKRRRLSWQQMSDAAPAVQLCPCSISGHSPQVGAREQMLASMCLVCAWQKRRNAPQDTLMIPRSRCRTWWRCCNI